MRVFISGGCKNGKSAYALRLAAEQEASPLYYIATMRPVDGDDEARIDRHRRERAGLGFITVEQPENIEEILDKCDSGGSFLLDSLTALLAGEMFRADGTVFENAGEKISRGLSYILDEVSNIVLVSDFIYSDAAIYDAYTEKYRRSLAMIDKAAAMRCETVLEAAYTGVITHKKPNI